MPSSHPIFKTILSVTPNFENHTNGIGSQLLIKIIYTRGLGKNGNGIVSPINPTLLTSRGGLGYDRVVSSSLSSKCEVVEENAPTYCDKHIDDMASNIILDENVVALNFQSKKTKYDLFAHPHQNKLPQHHHSWTITSPALRSL